MDTDLGARYFFLFLVALLLVGSTGHLSSHQVWRLSGQVDSLRSFLDGFASNSRHCGDGLEEFLDVWGEGRGWVDVSVGPCLKPWFEEDLKADRNKDILGTVLIEDVNALLEQQKELRAANSGLRASSNFSLEEYHSLQEIEAHLTSLAAEDDRVSLRSTGQTIEGRDLWLVTLAVGGLEPKPAVWIDCAIHAREWVSPATCLWLIDAVLSGYGVDETVTALMDGHDLYVMPVLNADGYDYSWSDERLWRKNRHPAPVGESCIGVDLNRNYNGTNWGGIGSSDGLCSETYHGSAPLSEAENQVVASQLLELSSSEGGLKASFSLHSYGGLWLFAYGWTSELPPDSDDLFRVGNAGAAAIEAVDGKVYNVGPHYTTIYPSTGTVVDYGYEVVGLPYTFIIEARDTGYGFMAPESMIAVTAEEIWQGVKTAVLAI